MSGRFIVFEGADGTGKSTQARLLAAHLGAVLTREPGGTAIGERIRELVLDPTEETLGNRTEALLMAAARAQHVEEIVRPSLADGRDVVSDRYYPSSLAYQGYGRGLDVEAVRALSTFATGGLEPDLVVLLEVGSVEASIRLDRPLDRIETDGDGLQDRVRHGYAEMAAAAPDRWVVVSGEGDPEVVATRVLAATAARLEALHDR